ncbi:MAG: undecaprenyl-diphosphate phosphatase [Candidatus Pacebacteria bacterium]|nr:undecaprenyl-diphosphate phosphatase [Candidatus Paceibacterota bacterium]
MNFWQAILLGLVQGLTEFLPISSSGHLFLIENLFKINDGFINFEIALHLATLFVVIVFFWPSIKKINKRVFFLLSVATLPLVLLTLLIKQQFNTATLSTQHLAYFFLFTGIINYFSFLKLKKNQELAATEKLEDISFLTALKIGLFQVLAILPGVSRSGLTLYAAFRNKLSAKNAFQFSFLLSIPVIIGSAIFDLLQTNGQSFGQLNWGLTLPAMLVAAISAWFSLKLLQKIIVHNHFLLFAFYCLFLGMTLLIVNF